MSNDEKTTLLYQRKDALMLKKKKIEQELEDVKSRLYEITTMLNTVRGVYGHDVN